MPALEYRDFHGVDVRNDPAAMDQLAQLRATNVSLLPGGAIERRGGLRKVCDVSQYSVGLYSANGYLRTVVPGGIGLQDTRPPDVFYDPIGDGADYLAGSVVKLHAVETIGSASVSNAFPYVVIERDTGRLEHHWLTAVPTLATDSVSTKVTLPFDPGKALIKSNNKLFANDPSNGVLWYSSTQNGPSDWTAPRDAGFLAVRQFVSGSRDITGLGYYRGGLVAVLFADAIELWKMDPDPTRFQLVTVFNGPGTEVAGTVANVLGDLFYFSRGGFRSLSITSLSGESNETDIGALIQDLTDDIDLDTVKPVCLWSQARSQFLCAFGADVWTYTYSPIAKRRGWTKWTLPSSVDYIVEHLGDLYIRSGNSVYIFDDTQVKDFGTADVTFDVQFPYWHAKRQGNKKYWKFIDTVQAGAANIYFHIDPVNVSAAVNSVGIGVNKTTYTGGLVGVNTISDVMSLRFTGTALWRLDSVTMNFDVLGMT